MPRFIFTLQLLFLFFAFLLLPSCGGEQEVYAEYENTGPQPESTAEGDTGEFGRRVGWWKFTYDGETSYRYFPGNDNYEEGFSLSRQVIPAALLLLLFFGGLIVLSMRGKYPVFYYCAVLLLPAAIIAFLVTLANGLKNYSDRANNDLAGFFGCAVLALLTVLPVFSIFNFFYRKKNVVLVVISIVVLVLCGAGMLILYGLANLFEGKPFGAG